MYVYVCMFCETIYLYQRHHQNSTPIPQNINLRTSEPSSVSEYIKLVAHELASQRLEVRSWQPSHPVEYNRLVCDTVVESRTNFVAVSVESAGQKRRFEGRLGRRVVVSGSLRLHSGRSFRKEDCGPLNGT